MSAMRGAAASLVNVANDMEDAAYNGEALAVCRACAEANDLIAEIATAAVEQGIRDGLTQKQLAQALDIPERALRGAKRGFA